VRSLIDVALILPVTVEMPHQARRQPDEGAIRHVFQRGHGAAFSKGDSRYIPTCSIEAPGCLHATFLIHRWGQGGKDAGSTAAQTTCAERANAVDDAGHTKD